MALCPVCHKHFEIKNKSKGQTFCCLRHYWDSLKGKAFFDSTGLPPWNKGKEYLAIRGKKHPNWKGGRYSQSYILRRTFKRSVQNQVFERDNYKCQICGQGGDLQVDHILSWADYPEKRFDINNCRTLCKNCHYLITFGKPIPSKGLPWGHNLSRMKGRIKS